MPKYLNEYFFLYFSGGWWLGFLLIFYIDFFRELEAKADALAKEIEGSSSNKLAIELENGDEEEAFSAVVRPGGQRGNNFLIKYLIIVSSLFTCIEGVSKKSRLMLLDAI